MTHREVVEIAYRWVLNNAKCGVAFKELYSSASNGEYPDVIGFNSWGHSVLVEVKISRSDFLSDKNKSFRKNPEQGMGTHRYYCCPKGMIKKEELPTGWGLIYIDEKKKARLAYEHLIVHTAENGYVHKEKFKHQKNIHAEHCLMYSALRRLHIRGRIDEIYIIDGEEPKVQEKAMPLKLNT